MSTATARRSDALSFDLESTAAFAAVAGAYVAALLLPLLLAVVPGRGAPAGQQYAAVLVGGPLLAALAWLPLRAVADGLGERLGASPAR